jgi:NTP pyrophosphatase (non-canonical NTP hydrolase)
MASDKFNDKTINELCLEAYNIAKINGWHEEKREFGTLIALMHSELSEALEAYRKDPEEVMWQNITEELADVCIRIFNACGEYDLDLSSAIENKMNKNKNRGYKYGGRRI